MTWHAKSFVGFEKAFPAFVLADLGLRRGLPSVPCGRGLVAEGPSRRSLRARSGCGGAFPAFPAGAVWLRRGLLGVVWIGRPGLRAQRGAARAGCPRQEPGPTPTSPRQLGFRRGFPEDGELVKKREGALTDPGTDTRL
jgi:hypothetical protein